MNLQIFEDLNGEFNARLREIASTTRSTAEGSSTITFRTARVESDYNPTVARKLAAGQLIAIPNVQTIGTNDVYSIYEIADVYPMHYSMLTLDRSQPAAIRKEFMELIEAEWTKGSKSTWMEIVAAPTGYIMKEKSGAIEFERKTYPPLTGSLVKLLSRESVQQLICHIPATDPENHTFGTLMGTIDESIPFTVDIEKLIHYHVGLFAFTGSGKSNMTATVVRKALNVVNDLKIVILDLSSEHGIHILDVLDHFPSRVIFTEPFDESGDKAEQYFRRHATPEALLDLEDSFRSKISALFAHDKIRVVKIPFAGEDQIARFSTYGGLIEVLGNTLNDKYGAVQQKLLVPEIIKSIREFLIEQNLEPEATFSTRTTQLIATVTPLTEKLPQNSTLKKIFESLSIVVEQNPDEDNDGEKEGEYSWETVVDEILSIESSAPRVFVLNLPEAEDARFQSAWIINRIFMRRKRSFTLTPRILFIIDEAQEFMPRETRRDDGTEQSSRAVERLLRHGRKYHLHGWISTQRIAHLNTNALQQLHSYFVSTMPRPYDRQLISDTFAIDDAFVDRTLAFQNGDWLLTSFKATATQNIPVFFHADNNEEVLRRYLAK